jgi:hypothetical protein
MEGVELHPWVDERGVHRFDPTEVDGVAEHASDGALQAPALAPAKSEGATLSALAVAEARVSELEARCRALETEAQRTAERERDAQRKATELRETAIEALGMVQTLLGAETPWAVRKVLADLRLAGPRSNV